MQMKSEGQFPVPNIFGTEPRAFAAEEKQPHMKKTETEWMKRPPQTATTGFPLTGLQMP